MHDYQKLLTRLVESGMPCRVLSVEALIEAKKSMSRPKDKETVIQLEAIREKNQG